MRELEGILTGKADVRDKRRENENHFSYKFNEREKNT
jgi:hypothetical protein